MLASEKTNAHDRKATRKALGRGAAQSTASEGKLHNACPYSDCCQCLCFGGAWPGVQKGGTLECGLSCCAFAAGTFCLCWLDMQAGLSMIRMPPARIGCEFALATEGPSRATGRPDWATGQPRDRGELGPGQTPKTTRSHQAASRHPACDNTNRHLSESSQPTLGTMWHHVPRMPRMPRPRTMCAEGSFLCKLVLGLQTVRRASSGTLLESQGQALIGSYSGICFSCICE